MNYKSELLANIDDCLFGIESVSSIYGVECLSKSDDNKLRFDFKLSDQKSISFKIIHPKIIEIIDCYRKKNASIEQFSICCLNLRKKSNENDKEKDLQKFIIALYEKGYLLLNEISENDDDADVQFEYETLHSLLQDKSLHYMEAGANSLFQSLLKLKKEREETSDNDDED
jgi:hypothetical protein